MSHICYFYPNFAAHSSLLEDIKMLLGSRFLFWIFSSKEPYEFKLLIEDIHFLKTKTKNHNNKNNSSI